MNSKPTVFVGMSGGVDSSVAALRLKKQGCNVVGVFIKVWHPDWLVCNWEQERLDAMRVAAHLDIPFLTCDAEQAYKQGVADYFIAEYTAGRTPNPDVMCNQQVKFGAFLEFAKAHGADCIATGHYVQKITHDEHAALHRGVDTNKDQSYFLWTLTNEQLAQSLFPVGDTAKPAIRAEAEVVGIPVAAKKDSQGICFLGQVDITEFLSHYVELVPGPVLNTAGETIGKHSGALVYTIGQRHGFTLHTTDSTRPHMYVVAKDTHANTITVAPERTVSSQGTTISLSNCVIRDTLTPNEKLEVQFRYRQTPVKATLVAHEAGVITLQLSETADTPAAGQSCVLYRDTHCLGGGIIG